MKKLIPSVTAVAIGVAGLAVTTPAQAAPTVVVAAVDAHANARHATTNFGNASAVKADGTVGQQKQAFIKFRIPAVPAGQRLDTVTLRLQALTSSGHGVTVHRTSSAWSEKALTWADKPAARALLGASDALTAGTVEVITLDVAQVTPGRTLSAMVRTADTSPLGFASSEATDAASRPSLRVTTTAVTEGGTTTPPSGSTPPPSDSTPPPSDSTPPPSDSTPPPTGAGAFPPVAPVAPKVIGMSAPSHLWDARLAEVGANGVKARRIFTDLSASGSGSLPLIREAIADGMMPVISYKVPDPAALASGAYDSWLATLRKQLDGLGARVTATFWHEPHGDMAPAVFRAASLRFFEGVNTPRIAVGPILNGWLLDRRVNDFASYTDAHLLATWEFVAVDSYQSGEPSNPGTSMPARAIPLLENWMDSVGHPHKPLGLGEYNGFSAQAIADAGEILLSTPEVWFGLAWNSQGDSYAPLSGDRITAFKRTKADPRAMR